MEPILVILGGTFLVSVLVYAALVVRGFVVSIMWQWFVVPLFHLPELSIPYAVGLSILVGLLTYQQQPDVEKKSKTDKIVKVLMPIFSPLITLFIAWIVHLFIQ